MATILYEHPLNERIRNYLKLEQLFAQVNHYVSKNILINHQTFFNALFAILNTLERSDIKGDLIKELEKVQQNLVIWSQAPGIDVSAIEDNLRKTVILISQLKLNTQRWYQLKEDKLLASLKQRFAIQGGSCSFDLPQLQFWLHQPIKEIEADIQRWLDLLANIKQSLSLSLKFIRQRADFVRINTDSGFYQNSGEGLLLLRIKIPSDAQHYPCVSGNKRRYSIRFMLPSEKNGQRYSTTATQFELACC